MELKEAIAFIKNFKAADADADKATVQAAFVEKYKPTQARSVWICGGFSVRFSQASGSSFSNTVLSLSALQKHDSRPFVVVLIRERDVKFILANATFLKKISHSSHQLKIDNIKGSFNGTDIMMEYEGLENEPGNFDQLFAQHMDFRWEENLERLVETTDAIVGCDRRFRPTSRQIAILEDAPRRAAEALEDKEFKQIEAELNARVLYFQKDILKAAAVDNVNLRGNKIEQLITKGVNAHELGDLEYSLGSGKRLVIDIKTKLLDRESAPKAYNIDKMLSFLSEQGSIFAFLMLGMSVTERSVSSRLLPVFDSVLLNATKIRHHWVGRVSRGVTQLSGHFDHASTANHMPVVDLARSGKFIKYLLDL